MSTKNSKDNSLHVKLDNPLDNRKLILSTTINVAKLLSSYSDIFDLVETKGVLMNSFKSTQNEIKELVKKLHKELPTVHYQEKPEPVATVVNKFNVKPKVVKEIPSADDEVARLKAELEDIDRKLRKL